MTRLLVPIVGLVLLLAATAPASQNKYIANDLTIAENVDTRGEAINDAGVVVGHYSLPIPGQNDEARPFSWQRGQTVTLSSTSATAIDINNHGDIIGAGHASVGGLHWTKKGEQANVGVGLRLTAINNHGVIAGVRVPVSPTTLVPFRILRDGVVEALELPPSANRGEAWDINDQGQIIGRVWNADPVPGPARPARWVDGRFEDLGMPDDTFPFRINSHGDIAGDVPIGGDDHRGFVWHDGSIRYLEPLSQHSNTSAMAINNRGDVVGYSFSPSGTPQQRMVIWPARSSTPVDLTDEYPHIEEPCGLTGHPRDINGRGQIVMFTTGGGPRCTFVLTPRGH